MSNELLIIGSGGLARTVIDLILNNKRKIKGIIDINFKDKNETINGIEVIGDVKKLDEYKPSDTDVVLAIGKSDVREKIYNKCIDLGFKFPTLIHDTAIISKTNVNLGKGLIVGAGSIIMSDVSIGDNTIIYSGCIIEHECNIGNHCTIAPSVKIAGRVQISNNVSIGIGSTIIDKIEINNSVIITGSLVINNIEENDIVYGIPAKPK